MAYFEKLGYSTTLLIYKKNNAIPFCNGKLINDTEYIVYVRDKGATFNQLPTSEMSKVIPANIVSKNNRKHVCQKPEIVIERLVKLFTNKKDVILDCFFGSGTTGVVAKKLGRKFIGIEINKKDCVIAQQRIDSV